MRFHIFSHRVSCCIRRGLCEGRLLALLLHTLLRRHGVRALLGSLLLLQVCLILQSLLLIGSHVLLRVGVAAHGLLDIGWHWRRSVGFLGRVEGGLAVDAIGVCGLWSVEAGLC